MRTYGEQGGSAPISAEIYSTVHRTLPYRKALVRCSTRTMKNFVDVYYGSVVRYSTLPYRKATVRQSMRTIPPMAGTVRLC
jgi:hypothetical protein